MLKSSQLLFLLTKVVQNILSPIFHSRRKEKRALPIIKIENNNCKKIFITKGKSTDGNQHFLSHEREQREIETNKSFKKQIEKHIHTEKLQKQFVGSRQSIICIIPNSEPV